jgi:four helix bundle protein
MNTYKNLEIYKLAISLAIKVYKFNIMISENLLLKYGNRLRRASFMIKDLIAEGYSVQGDDKQLIRSITFAETLTEEVLSLLKQMKADGTNQKQIEELIQSYKLLKKLTGKLIQKLQEENNEYLIPFPENKLLELV